ncbi:MAG: type I restriction-modification system subunit M [Malacoplasma sp.]|nr:type I restriction-modification system subunit M [Malacoplasma sp.]
MADTKKKQEREELHRAIWAIADELRGRVSGIHFMNYVLSTMFYRYISEHIANYINENEVKAGNVNFDYSQISDIEAEMTRGDLVKEIGFFILPSELFCNVRAKAKDDNNLNETIEKVFRNIEESAKGTESEQNFSGLFDDFDVNSKTNLGETVNERNRKLLKLLDGIANMNLGNIKNHDIDVFGDAYEYLLSKYASNAGQSGGEFFTPADVSELLTRLGTVGKEKINKVYDPACGSGSLLLKAVKVLGKDNIDGFFGQESNPTTYNLCRINMFLHDIGFHKFDIKCGDTLISPAHKDDGPFDLIVSNPPYSIEWEGDNNPLLINDARFSPASVLAPRGYADMAFIMHSLYLLSSHGAAAIVCFPGIMYRRGAEQKIRKYLIDNNFIDCIIQLPSNLFFGTPIGTCIMVLKKCKENNKTFFINASNECIKATNNNKLTQSNIKKIVETFANKNEEQYFSHLATQDEIVRNNYNLSISNYVQAKDTREKINIVEINAKIAEIVKNEQKLRSEIDTFIKEIEK